MLKNAIWIILCKVVQSVLGLVISMFSARYLGPSNYGLINYAASIVAFAVPIMQLGLRSTLVREIVENSDKEGETIGTAICLNITAAIACIIGIISFVIIANKNEKVTIIVCFLYSLNLIFQALEMIQYWFQAKLLSKYTSLTMLFSYLLVSGYKIHLLVAQKSIYWFCVSNTIDYCTISIILLFLYRKIGGEKLSFSPKRAKEMFSKSKYYIVSGLMVTVFQQTDRLMLKLMMDDAATGYYSAAVNCAGMASFVYGAIIDSMRPVILKLRKHSVKAFENRMIQLYSIIFYMSILQSLVMSIFANQIIELLYGESFTPAATVLKIVVWYVPYSYFGAVRNIWILSENKEKCLWIINLSGAMMNVVLNSIFIPCVGMYGAAVASVITQVFANFILGFLIKSLRYNNKLLIQGLNPNYVITSIKIMMESRGGL